jgi:hypothetical protein
MELAFTSSSTVAAGIDKETEFGFHKPTQSIRRLTAVIDGVQAPLLALNGTLRKIA